MYTVIYSLYSRDSERKKIGFSIVVAIFRFIFPLFLYSLAHSEDLDILRFFCFVFLREFIDATSAAKM